uniref:Uncharacterized protein n=1 Tax=Romanomermis culicivorax TaxID=13658 RepID=A0A915KPC8_ROMCU
MFEASCESPLFSLQLYTRVCAAELVKVRRRRRCCSAKAVGCIGAASLKASSSSARIMNREKRENALITTLRKCDQKSTQTLHQLKELYAGDRKLMSREQHYLKRGCKNVAVA